MTKTCNRCKNEKATSEFYRCKRTKDGFNYRCKQCDGAMNRAWRAKDIEHARRLVREADARYRANDPKFNLKKRLKKYGLSEAEFEAIKGRFDGLCWVCRKVAGSCVDHCHRQGQVRGWLCEHCNKALGLLYDDTEVLARAVEYLNGS